MNIKTESLKQFAKAVHAAGLFFSAGILLAVIGIGFGGLIAPSANYLGKVRAELRNVKIKVSETERAIKETKDFDALLAEKKEIREMLDGRTLNEGEQAKVISEITETSGDLEMNIVNIAPVEIPKKSTSEDAGKKFRPVYFQLEVLCRYKILGSFFEGLEAGPLALEVRSLRAAPQMPNSDLLQVQMQLAAYMEPFK